MAITLKNIGDLCFDSEQFEEAVPYCFQSYQIFKQIGSPNAENALNYLNALIEKLGEERVKELLAEIQ